MAGNTLEEVSSFVNKFVNLWKSGCDASLHMESQAGQAFVTIRLGLGTGAYSTSNSRQNKQFQHSESKVKKVSPSRMRRRARRSAARQVAAESDTVKKEAAEVSSLNTGSEEELDDSRIENICDLCDFSSNWKNGLAIHIATVHESSLEKKLKREEDWKIHNLSQKYWKTGLLESNLQVYVNCLMDVENAKVNEAVKVAEETKLETLWNEMQASKPKLFPP